MLTEMVIFVINQRIDCLKHSMEKWINFQTFSYYFFYNGSRSKFLNVLNKKTNKKFPRKLTMPITMKPKQSINFNSMTDDPK